MTSTQEKLSIIIIEDDKTEMVDQEGMLSIGNLEMA